MESVGAWRSTASQVDQKGHATCILCTEMNLLFCKSYVQQQMLLTRI
ncbi:hypothetical protein KP509_05G083400 [Ceratopteris richardii]|uniref:Uncharacterized protein n=1 Tax=Ceratopteris richardii TaxID=49495 RepID=A0A8T2UVP5_CERRI|nr:hypothetical protein KP509_05G083400 [Ceratopteris richardii]